MDHYQKIVSTEFVLEQHLKAIDVIIVLKKEVIFAVLMQKRIYLIMDIDIIQRVRLLQNQQENNVEIKQKRAPCIVLDIHTKIFL